jgi:predicted transcriptional regulator
MRRKAIKRRRTVAGEAKEQKQEERRSVVARTTEIAAAYITGNTVAMADLGDVIETIGRALQALGREDTTPASARPEPAVPVRRSIQPDHLVCLICGKRLKTIRRHLSIVHQLTPEVYRELFGLKPDYPMVAAGYSRQRSETAKRVGLGRNVQASRRSRRPKNQE